VGGWGWDGIREVWKGLGKTNDVGDNDRSPKFRTLNN
jgi:hypothetical protein